MIFNKDAINLKIISVSYVKSVKKFFSVLLFLYID